MKLKFALTIAVIAVGSTLGADTPRSTRRLEKEVRHELVMLPFYGVFDNLVYRINGERVELLGQVRHPALKKDAERVVKSIEGVE